MKKENEINRILESATEINQVDANPYLFNKICDKLEAQPDGTLVYSKVKIGWVVMITLTIALNISTLLFYGINNQKQQKVSNIEALSNEINLTNTYNY